MADVYNFENWNDDTFVSFFHSIDCVERIENPRCFYKGVRAVLIDMGYDPDFINGEFYDRCFIYNKNHQ